MGTWPIVMVLAGTLVLTAHAGTIRGTVRAEAREGTAETPAGGGYESRKFKFAERVDYSALREFVVYVDEPHALTSAPPAKVVQVVTQKDATFAPHVMPVMAGTTVEWPNRDEIQHNVFSFSEPKQFDLGYYKEEIKRVTFDKPGRVDVFCSIHTKMHCIILVVETPFFAATDPRGSFVLTNVPAGRYRLKAWHERLPPETKEVTVPASGEVKVDFVLGVKNLPKY